MTKEQVVFARNTQIYDSIKSMFIKLPSAIVIALFAGVLTYAIMKMLDNKNGEINKKAHVFYVSYIAFLFDLTVLSRETQKEIMVDLIPFDTPGGIHLVFVYAIANWFIFIPLGITLMFLYEEKRCVKGIVLEGIAVSVLIEILQLLLRRGVCQVEDVIMNGLGIITGCIAYKVYRKMNEGKSVRKNIC